MILNDFFTTVVHLMVWEGGRSDTRITANNKGDRVDSFSLETSESSRFFFFTFDRGRGCYQLSVLLKPRLDFHASHREVAGPNGVGDDRIELVS